MQIGGESERSSRKAAAIFADLRERLLARGAPRERAQRIVFQCAFRIFAESIGLSLKEASEGSAQGAYRRLSGTTAPIDLDPCERELIREAESLDWASVEPALFGELFLTSLDDRERHARGAHYTSETDILRIVEPTIVRPWTNRILEAKTVGQLDGARSALSQFRVLDPSCGCGNFLVIAYRELVRLDTEIVRRQRQLLPPSEHHRIGVEPLVTIAQLFGIDSVPMAAELTRIVLAITAKLARDRALSSLGAEQTSGRPLSFLCLGNNIQCKDALFHEWPAADAIIGNPPFQAKNKMQAEFGAKYVARLRRHYPDVPGRSDYCVYWFRRAHDHLAPGGRAGLVGTNTIKQNYSREGSLEYITKNGGTITEAVGTQVWRGEATVHVSIVNWIKGTAKGEKLLHNQKGDTPDGLWESVSLDRIGPSLSARVDLTCASVLRANTAQTVCYQGQTHGHDGFVLSRSAAIELLAQDPTSREVLFPYLVADDFLGRQDRSPSRWAIDFHPRDMEGASRFAAAFAHVRNRVLPGRETKAKEEHSRNAEALRAHPRAKVNRHHARFLQRWWLYSWPRDEMIGVLSKRSRYIVCARVTRRPIFEFVSSKIRPNDALQVFALDDDYSFGVLQSSIHWQWLTERGSTLKQDYRYTSETVFETFPWPQAPSLKAQRAVASAARELRAVRLRLLSRGSTNLRALYRSLAEPGESALRDATAELDDAVRGAFGMGTKTDVLAFLLELNQSLAAIEARGQSIIGPGIASLGSRPLRDFLSDDCVAPPSLS